MDRVPASHSSFLHPLEGRRNMARQLPQYAPSTLGDQEGVWYSTRRRVWSSYPRKHAVPLHCMARQSLLP
jgi:hypothetical protein